jgi:hypothetical protein
VVAVEVTNPGKGQIPVALNGAFTYVDAAPTFTLIAPSTGLLAGGFPLQITGSHFRDGTTVYIGGNLATAIVVVGPGLITCLAPDSLILGPANLLVINPDGQQFLAPGAFTYLDTAPVVTLVAPSTGLLAGGTSLQITGDRLLGGATVYIGGSLATAIVVVGPKLITCEAPASLVEGKVEVLVIGPDGLQARAADAFEYVAPPPPPPPVTPPVVP